MPRSECRRFEDAVAIGAEPECDLAEHASVCPRCRTLAQIAALRVAPVATASDDVVVAAALATASEIAHTHAVRWECQRGRVPVLIGVMGYLVAAVSMVFALVPGITSPAMPQPFDSMAPPVLATPDLRMMAAVFIASGVWTTAIALMTRSRRSAVTLGA